MEMHVQCCVCKKFKKNEEWMETPSHSQEFREAKISHTYCPHCLSQAMEEIKRERQAATSGPQQQ